MASYTILGCDYDTNYCDGYLSIGTLDFNFEPASYYEKKSPPQFFAEIIDTRNRKNTCCFILSSADQRKNVLIQPETLELYEFDEETPVSIVKKCICDDLIVTRLFFMKALSPGKVKYFYISNRQLQGT